MFQACDSSAAYSDIMMKVCAEPDCVNAAASATSSPNTAMPRTSFMSGPRPEQALRAEQQHQDEDREDPHLPQRIAQVQPGQRLGHADQQAAGQRPGKAAHAAQHDD